jgi:hypothetical protein
MDTRTVRLVTDALNRDLFGARLPSLKLCWHGDERPTRATIWEKAHILSLHVDAEFAPRSELCAVLTHELCRLAIANETIDHGPRWRSVMVRQGLDPDTGALLPGGRLSAWITAHRWW